MSDLSASDKAALMEHQRARSRRSLSLTHQPFFLPLKQQQSAADSSRSEAEGESSSGNAAAAYKKKDKKKDKEKDKDKKKRGLVEPAPALAKAVSEPSSPRTKALQQRRRDSERLFRTDVLSILDAQQEAITRMAAAVETLQQQQQQGSCCMGQGGGGGAGTCVLV